MILFKKLNTRLESLSAKTFSIIGGILISITIAIGGLIIFWHFNAINHLYEQLEEINALRKDRIQPLLIRAKRVRKEHEKVDALLAQDPNFKIGEVIENILTELHLIDNAVTRNYAETEREEKYIERVLSMRLENIDMKQLAQLLERIESNQRITMNTIEIVKSKKKLNKLEVSLTIAELQPKELEK